MIQISGLTKYFGPQKLFEDITWQIDRFARTALVGHNGAGKSTMLRIIAGELEADGGSVIIPKTMTVGYLPQEITLLDAMPALDLVLSGRQDLLDLADEIERLQAVVEANPSDQNIEQLGACQHAYETGGGYRLRSEAQSIMASLGFAQDELTKLTTEFSGGWQMRILLARLLLSKPDLLLLDEPTNHLDIESLAWLESFLAGYPGVLLVVSHDRAFLNHVIDGVASLDDRTTSCSAWRMTTGCCCFPATMTTTWKCARHLRNNSKRRLKCSGRKSRRNRRLSSVFAIRRQRQNRCRAA